MYLTVVVPAFNEGDRIFANLREIAETLASFSTSWEIILVNDGSTDQTHAEAIKAQQYIRDLRVLSYPRNCGKGFALSYGAREARGDLVAFLDGDLELHPNQIPMLVEVMNRRGADLVVGSKRHAARGSAGSGQPFPLKRRILGGLYSLLVKLMFRLPVRDTQTGLKLFRRQVLLDALPSVCTTRFAFDLDLLVHAHRIGYRAAEAPVAVRFLRRSNRLNARDVFRIWVDTLKLYRCARIPWRWLPRREQYPFECRGAPASPPRVDPRA